MDSKDMHHYLDQIECKLWKLINKYFTDDQLDYLDDKTIYMDDDMFNPLVRVYHDNKRN